MRKKAFMMTLYLAALLASCEEEKESGRLSAEGVLPGQIYVDFYKEDKACNGTTLFGDLHNPDKPRLVEVDMKGAIVWSLDIPEQLAQYTEPGMDVETIEGGNVLVVLPGYGVYEFDRAGNTVWSHRDSQISYDADRLSNGNTIYVCGNFDTAEDAQVKEIDQGGHEVWSWKATSVFNSFDTPYNKVERQGWTHTNAVTRLENGNTLINVRNFNQIVEVGPDGKRVWSFDWSTFGGADAQDPEMQAGGTLVTCLDWSSPNQAVEFKMESGQKVWGYNRQGLGRLRDCNRLPNGNTLIVGVLEDDMESVIFEITSDGELVWELKIMDTPVIGRPGWFYKAERKCGATALEGES